ncbi:MAG TPA: hemerythrin domain-containing protein [Chitinophagaceae bacterium]
MKPILLAVLLIASVSLQAQVQKDSAHKTHHQENKKVMKFEIPGSLKAEHKKLHETLLEYTRLPGKTGTAAKEVAKLLHPHFVKEEEYALPQLGLLPALAKGQVSADMKEAVAMGDKLKQDFDQMLSEHRQIVGALDNLQKAAREERRPEVVRFTEALKLHAQTEEEVLYPAAILISEYLKLIL